jgi:hypothetical protein
MKDERGCMGAVRRSSEEEGACGIANAALFAHLSFELQPKLCSPPKDVQGHPFPEGFSRNEFLDEGEYKGLTRRQRLSWKKPERVGYPQEKSFEIMHCHVRLSRAQPIPSWKFQDW